MGATVAYGWSVSLIGVVHDIDLETGLEEGGHEKATLFAIDGFCLFLKLSM